MKLKITKEKLLKSKLFIKLFLSYVVIISLLFSIYSFSALIQYQKVFRDNISREYKLKATSIGNALDFELLSAQHIISSINSSTTVKSLYSTISSKDQFLNSYLLYQSQQELKNIKVSTNSYSIYNILLLFEDYDKAYTASSVIQLNEDYGNKLERPFLRQGRVDELLQMDSVEDILFNTEFVIYGAQYSYSAAKNENGTILILFGEKYLEQKIERIAETNSGYSILFNGESIMTKGDLKGTCFEVASNVHPEIVYRVYVDINAFPMKLSASLLIALIVGVVFSITFVVLAFVLSRRYYSPIGNIERMVESGEVVDSETTGSADEEINTIIKGISHLIGENNGYREKMIHISPYAKQGMLHGILNGNMEQDSLSILINEKYIDLKRNYFALAMTNIVFKSNEVIPPIKLKDAIDIIQGVCQEQSTESVQIDCYVKDLNNVFLIVNSDEEIQLEDEFFRLYDAICKEIDDESCLITIGVGLLEDNINRLNAACRDAIKALDGMLTGGRQTVYFYERSEEKDKKEYYFPKDASGRLLRDFKENNIDDLHAFLDEIYEENTQKYDESPETIRLMLDELHIQTLNVLKTLNAYQTAQIQIDKIDQAATLDEYFTYYHAIYDAICKELTNLLMPKKDIEKLDKDILDCIDENIKNPDLSLAFLCDRFGVSNKYISMICKNHLGKTYLQYVQEKRIFYASELLQTTEKSMEEIASLCGYSNVLTFRRNFKSIMNVNPGDYR